MPKGDRLKLKADPEDGTTPIANLLLEAVAIAKLSGLQKGAIVHLWRNTYGWIGDDGQRQKEKKITLSEWAKALDSENARVSHALSELVDMNIIIRRMTDSWGGYYYKLNTQVSQWNSGSINHAKLKEVAKIPDFSDVANSATVVENAIVVNNDNSCPNEHATVVENATQQLSKTQLPTLYKEILNKDINKEAVGEKVKQVFYHLDLLRGYKPPKRNAEAASIIRMIKKDYTPDQIILAWENLKKSTFWSDKELYMMSVESQIGATLKNIHKTTEEKWGHVVQR